MTTLYQLTDFGVLRVAGSGNLALLQGQLTADVSAIAKEGQLAAHCLPNGRIISLFYLTQIEADFYCILPHDLLPIAQKALLKYAPFFKATLTDVSADWFVYGAVQPIKVPAAATISLPHQQAQLLLSNTSLPSESDTQNTWHAIEMRAGIARLSAVTSGLFLPHELRLPQLNAVSFNKGCYTGQEIIARMHYRGKLKTHWLLAKCDSMISLEPGKEITTPELNLMIVDVCHHANETYALGLSQQTMPHFTYQNAHFTLTDLSHV